MPESDYKLIKVHAEREASSEAGHESKGLEVVSGSFASAAQPHEGYDAPQDADDEKLQREHVHSCSKAVSFDARPSVSSEQSFQEEDADAAARFRHERLMAKAEELERQERNLSGGRVPMSGVRIALLMCGVVAMVLIVLWGFGVLSF